MTPHRRVLVTGARGFLGRHVAAALSRAGWSPVLTDVDDCDVCDARQTLAVVRQTAPQVICHLAGLTGAARSLQSPRAFYDVNVTGTLNVLEAARHAGVRGVVFASSLTVHGATDRPVDEDAPIDPRHPYAASKAAGELLCRAYAAHYGLHAVALRPTLITGPGQTEPNAVVEFIDAIEREGRVVLLGDGAHAREWLHPADAGHAFARAVDRAASEAAGRWEAFVISSGVPVRMRELAEAGIRALGRGAVTFAPATRQAFSLTTRIDRARDELGWAPSVELDRIVRELCAARESSTSRQEVPR